MIYDCLYPHLPPRPASLICIGNGHVINSSLVPDPGDRKKRKSFYISGKTPATFISGPRGGPVMQKLGAIGTMGHCSFSVVKHSSRMLSINLLKISEWMYSCSYVRQLALSLCGLLPQTHSYSLIMKTSSNKLHWRLILQNA